MSQLPRPLMVQSLGHGETWGRFGRVNFLFIAQWGCIEMLLLYMQDSSTKSPCFLLGNSQRNENSKHAHMRIPKLSLKPVPTLYSLPLFYAHIPSAPKTKLLTCFDCFLLQLDRSWLRYTGQMVCWGNINYDVTRFLFNTWIRVTQNQYPPRGPTLGCPFQTVGPMYT